MAETMANVVRYVVSFTRKHPVSRGMISYAVLWPVANICQQTLEGREFNWRESLRYSLFGAGYIAPVAYAWVKIAGILVPGNSLRVAITKVLIEQVSYSPVAISGFYIGMAILEGRNLDQIIEELKEKFIPTYKTGVCIWPIAQTINFAFIKERNRVMFTSTVSFFWTVYISHMKHLQLKSERSQSEC